MRQRDDRNSGNRNYRAHLREIRAGLVPPLVNRATLSRLQDHHSSITTEEYSTAMSESDYGLCQNVATFVKHKSTLLSSSLSRELFNLFRLGYLAWHFCYRKYMILNSYMHHSFS